MTDETQDTTEETQEEVGEESEALESQEEEDGGPKFSKAQLQQIGSLMGRIVKTQIEKDVLPMITESTRRPAITTTDNDDAVGKLQQELSEQIFSGKPFEAISRVVQLSQQAQTNLTKTKQLEVDKTLVSYAEKPLYKDIFQTMKGVAEDAVQNKGYPVAEAVEYAYQLARADHYEKQLNPSPDEGDNLGLLKGGKHVRPGAKPKLPPRFKEAYERDKAKGLFKNEQEYIDCLSPQVREQYGI